MEIMHSFLVYFSHCLVESTVLLWRG